VSIKILQKGIADSIQDSGRFGYQHFGVQPNGCMDLLSATIVNYILQNDLDNPVIELHFPSSKIQFLEAAIICISGANFVPILNEKSIPFNTPILVAENDVLSMLQPLEGTIAYIGVKGKYNGYNWLNSYSNKILFFIASNNIINTNGNTDNFNFVNNSLINIEFYYNNDLKMSIPTFCTLTKLTTNFTFLEGTYPNIGNSGSMGIGSNEFYFYPLYPLVNSLTNTPYLFETLNDINGPTFYEDFFNFNIKSNSSLCYNTTQLNLLNTRITSITFPTGFVCFKEGSKILTDQGYRLIEDLKPGDLVKTELNDYKPIVMMGKKEILVIENIV
jgi:hypothetical protein